MHLMLRMDKQLHALLTHLCRLPIGVAYDAIEDVLLGAVPNGAPSPERNQPQAGPAACAGSVALRQRTTNSSGMAIDQRTPSG